MKNLKYLFYALLATFALAACSEDSTSPAEPDVENCYNVYFPSQDNAADLTLDPAAPTTLEFTVMRSNDKDAITVPVEILASEEDIFTASEIEFAEGQTETTFVVEFPQAALGTPYSCTLAVTDPQYVSKYTGKPAFVKFSILRAKWITVDADKSITYDDKVYEGYEWYTDDIVTYAYGVPVGTTYPVKVEVREDTIDEDYPNGKNGLAGLYRMIEPYGAGYPYNDPGDYVDGMNIEIDARNPKQVFIRTQNMGMDWGDGDFYISSLAYQCLRNPANGDPDEYYGKIENGAIIFPTNALLAAEANYNGGAFYQANKNGDFRLVICQDLVVDYSLKLTADEPEDGEIAIAAKLGTDVAKVKYAFFEGSLSAAQLNENSANIDAGKVESAQELTATGVITATFETTGVYTMIANIYDKEDKLQGYESVSFGYIAADDEKPVVLSCGITITDKYAPQGYTSEDSAEIYIYGENIVSGSFALIETEKLAAIEDKDKYLDEKGNKFTAAQLNQINGSGFSGVIGNLIGGTEYTLVVKAFNGYISDYKFASATTNGTPHPLKRTYTAADIDVIGGGKAELFKKWNYYAKCSKMSKREYLGQVEFKENENDYTDNEGYDVDVIDVTGLTAQVGTQLKFDDTLTFEYNSGFICALGGQSIDASFQGMPLGILYRTVDGNIYDVDWTIIGGYVEEGYIAFVANSDYIDYNLEFDGFGLYAFTDETMSSIAGALEIFTNLMFVDPAVDDMAPEESSAAPKAVSMHALRNLAVNAATPNNFVELRGRERMRALIDEMRAGKNVRNAAQSLKPVEMPALGEAKAKVSFKQGLPQQSFDRSMLEVKRNGGVRFDN